MSELSLHRISSPEEAGRSPLEEIRDLFQRAKQRKRLVLSLPGEIGEHVRVRYQPRDDFEPVEDGSPLDISLDYLIYLCDAIEVRGADDWEELTYDGNPVRFYPAPLRELFGIEGDSARAVTLAMFSGAPLPQEAVADHVSRLSRWMRTGKARIDEEELLGES